ncbi:CHAT domain-containing protein, partial [Actinomadura adrarensis]
MANEIELGGAGREVRVALGRLGEDLVGMSASSRRGYELPLVVMNACGSARMHATGAVSFPYLFLQNGNRGFIGSEIEIPDDLAAEFSKALYTHLILRRLPLGESMLGARRDLLRDFRNPLVLACSSYADPDIRVVGRTALVEEVIRVLGLEDESGRADRLPPAGSDPPSQGAC